MAITPFTSEWEWLTINRGLDYTVVDGAQLKRNNWTLTRARYSNAIYSSELDTKSSSLTGYNGGVNETISAVTGAKIAGIQFDTTTTYTLNTTTWIDSGSQRYGFPVYIQEASAANIPDSSKTNVMAVFGTPLATSTTLCWAVVEVTNDEAQTISFSASLSTHTNYVRAATFSASPPGSRPEVDGQTMLASTAAGTFSPTSDSVPVDGIYDTTGVFLCTADNQNYQQQGVEWYQQIQTWSYKDSWRTA